MSDLVRTSFYPDAHLIFWQVLHLISKKIFREREWGGGERTERDLHVHLELIGANMSFATIKQSMSAS